MPAGAMRGRVIPVPEVPGLRPTPAKVRQALFNILGPVDGFDVLDLYAGSGIMALEALSRGATSAVSIERQHRAVRSIRQACALLQLEARWQIRHGSVEQGLMALSGSRFDLIFADPPYAQGLASALPALLDRRAVACDRLVIEESAREQPEWPAGWQCLQSRRYGDSCLHFLTRTA